MIFLFHNHTLFLGNSLVKFKPDFHFIGVLEEEKRHIVDWHNEYRGKVSEYGQPSATDMQKMVNINFIYNNINVPCHWIDQSKVANVDVDLWL